MAHHRYTLLDRPQEARLGGAIGAGNVGRAGAAESRTVRSVKLGYAEDCLKRQRHYVQVRCPRSSGLALLRREFNLPFRQLVYGGSTPGPAVFILLHQEVSLYASDLRVSTVSTSRVPAPQRREVTSSTGSTRKLIFNPSPRSRCNLRFERGARLTDDCSVVTHCRCLLLGLAMIVVPPTLTPPTLKPLNSSQIGA